VTVPAHQGSVTFTVATHAVNADTWTTIAPDFAGPDAAAEPATLLIQAAPTLVSLTLDPATVTGGQASAGTVTLSSPPPACDASTIRLASGDPMVATVPGSVTIAPGSATATFTVSTAAVQHDTGVTVTATFGSGSTSASLAVKASAPAGVFNDNLANAAPLALPGFATGDTNLATIEPGEPVLSGTCFVLTTHHLENSVWFKLTPTQSGTLTVSTANPGTNFDSVLALYADPGAAGAGGLGTPLGCDNNGDGNGDPNLVAVEHTGPGGPGTPIWSSIMHVSVEAGRTYYLQLGGVGGAPFGHYVLTAEVNPGVLSPSVLSGMHLDAGTVMSGGSATGTVTLSAPAPAGGVIVALSSDTGTASVPGSVIVPEGAVSATFTVQAGSVTADTGVTITGSFEGRTQSAALTIKAG
jgi:hypothetical protein